ncbi:MAG: hypothetical protein ACTSRG_20530 [Candidatus Helarchaeota archaeon]
MVENTESFRLRQWDYTDKRNLFLFGIGARIFYLTLTFLIFANTVDLVDMVEKVAIGINYFISGQNPYGTWSWYFLHTGETSPMSAIYIYFFNEHPELWLLQYLPSNFFPDWWYVDFFYQYPPLSIIAYLPTVLYPNSMYPMDFRLSFFIINTMFDAYIFYRLVNHGIRWPAIIFWANPLFGMLLAFNSIISLPLLFLTLGLVNSDNPKKVGLYLGLATISYTYSIIVLGFFLFDYLSDTKKLKQFFLGLLIPILIFGAFLAWNPMALLSNLFLSQFGHPPYSFNNTPYGLPALHLTSIPPYVYTFTKPLFSSLYAPTIYSSSIGIIPGVNGFSGVWWGGYIITTYMYIATFIISFYLIIDYFKNHRGELYYTLGYSFIILGLLVLSSPGGFAHYTTIPLLVAILGWQQREIRKKQTINN